MSICHHVYFTVILQCSTISVPTICMVTTADALADRPIRAVLIDRNDRFIGGCVFDERGILGYRVELSDRLVINH